jgi:subtilisin family serine protease
MNKFLLSLAIGTVLTASSVVSAQNEVDRKINRAMPANLQSLKLSSPLQAKGVDVTAVRAAMVASGDNGVIIRLSSPSVAEQKLRGKAAKNAKKNLKAEQVDLLSEVMALDPNARVLAQTQLVLNAVFVEVNPSVLSELANHPGVLSIAPVANYELDLSETVPYIGATAVQADGFDGSGIRVAVLDSGVDYYHAALGGSGNPADYAADDPTIIEPGTFPTAKVVGGYDFVGQVWPGGPLAPDPDPLDLDGHGTHVADIIGGTIGVAPGASIYGVQVCSSVSSSCSGVALIQGMEFSVDPDRDGDPSDAVDIINMSLGANYGQPFDDDLSAAVDNATALGVLTVSSAGNGSDKPYVTGTPSSAPTALSVAQTQVPSAFVPFINVDGVDYLAVFQPWSTPPGGVIGGPVQYGDGAGGNLNGCAPFAAGSLAGKVVLVDRGACFFSDKIQNIEDGGGVAGIIGLVAPGEPFAGGCGDPCPFPAIPGYMISQDDSNAVKAQIGDPGIATIDPANGLPLVGSMVSSSSRGPQHEATTLLKPEIGAPGASVSAIAGTGTGTSPFGGTSGAAPMIAGSAALLLQASPDLSPLEVKAVLMNNGETAIFNDAVIGDLAPVSRIGGGEVRIDRAVAAPAAAWDDDVPQGGLSFGFVDVSKDTVNLFKTVRVRNYSDSDISYDITPTFRYADDEASGAVAVSVPNGKLKVKAGKDTTFVVKMTIKGALLPGNFMNSGSMGANPDALTANEYDGYLVLDDGEHPIHMAWHVLPRQASNVVGRQVLNFNEFGEDLIDLTNDGVGTAQNDAYALIAVSPNMPEGGFGQQSPTPDLRAVGVNTFPVPAGFCSGDASFIWAFSVNTWERQQHLMPVTNLVALDTDRDGQDDYVVLNRDFSGPNTLTDGRHLTWVLNTSTGGLSAFFFAEHSMNTGNTVLYICGEQIGMNAGNFFQNVDARVEAQDWYYGGPGDVIDGLTIAPLGEQYLGLPDDIPGKSEGTMTVIDFGPLPGNTQELGVMMIGNGDRGGGARGGSTQSTEALLFRIK